MNVQPKDLAMVVNAPMPWAGATCTVVEALEVPADTVTYPGPYWRVLFARPMPCGAGGQVHACDVAFPDSMLRKLSGPDVLACLQVTRGVSA